MMPRSLRHAGKTSTVLLELVDLVAATDQATEATRALQRATWVLRETARGPRLQPRPIVALALLGVP